MKIAEYYIQNHKNIASVRKHPAEYLEVQKEVFLEIVYVLTRKSIEAK